MDNTPDSIYIKDENDIHIYGNREAIKSVGKKPDEFIGSTTRDLFPPQIADKLVTLDREVMTGNVPKISEEWRNTEEGDIRWRRDIKFPIELESGKRILGGIAIDITDLDFQLYCHPGNWGLRLSNNPPPRDVDARISGRLMALVNLSTQEDKLSTSIGERVSFDGNVALAQKMQDIIAKLDIDWEEALAQHTGDVLAFQIHRRARRLGEWLQSSADSLLRTSSEYLREEARLTPTLPEYRQFQSRVNVLKNDVARAEQRLQRLLDKADRD